MRVVRLRNPHVSRRARGRWWGGGRCLRLLPLLCILLIIIALGILAVSEMTLAQKRQVGPIGVSTGGAAARIMPGRAQHPQQPHQQTQSSGSAFKIEPLLRRNAPSVELAAQVAQNAARAAEVARIILRESTLPVQHTYSCASPLGDCPAVPPNLRGPINVSSSPVLLSESEVETRVGVLGPGGSWRPPDCTPRHTVAIVIPYRDRWEQLMTLLYTLHPLLQRQQLQYRIFVVEQTGNDAFNKGVLMNAGFLTTPRLLPEPGVISRHLQTCLCLFIQTGNDTFNKGVLMNAGFLTALRMLPEPGVTFHCFVFHDVDMLPEDDRNMYSCPVQPRHMSVAVNELDYKLPYRQLVGGVFAIRSEHFFKVNGYSNLYWGWGGEDDDMGYRVEHVLTTISRPPEEIARYTMIRHEKRKPLAWKVRVKLLRTSWRRYRLDGLNTVQFSLAGVEPRGLYTRLLVDAGHPPQNIRLLQQQQDSEDRRTTPPPATTTPS